MNILIVGKENWVPKKEDLLLKQRGYIVERIDTISKAKKRLQDVDAPLLVLLNTTPKTAFRFCKEIRDYSLSHPFYLMICVEKTDEDLIFEGITAGADVVVDLASGNELFLAYLQNATRWLETSVEKHLKAEEDLHRLAGVVEQSVESIMITDTDGVICYTNKTFEKLTGYTAQEVIGKKPNILQSGQHDLLFYELLWKKISKGERWEGRLINVRKDGQRFYVESMIYPIHNKQGEIINYVSICHDITHEKAIEKEIRQAQKMVMLGELAGGISHDFNNILTAILGYVALCMNAVDDTDQIYAYLKEIVRAGDRAAKLVRQILSFSRQEEQDFHSISISSVLHDSLSMVRPVLGSDITVQQTEDCPNILVHGDPTQLQQVFVNLYTNAIHAMEKTGGVLTIQTQSIELLGKWHQNRWVGLPHGFYAYICIQDTGCGMKKEVVEHIFDPYFTTKKKGQGTGFGLSIVRNIIQKHGGMVCVESEEGQGTTFSIYLPLVLKSDTDKTKESKKMLPTGSGHLLLVDDDTTLLEMGKQMLESFGFTVETTDSGKKAIALFKKNPIKFDALLTDYSMPTTPGNEVIRKCKKIDPDLPTFLLSGRLHEIEDSDFEDLGKISFVPKPVNWRRFSRMLQQAIDQQRS